MPQTDTGILLIVGAIFLLIGLLGGRVEIAAAKIPSVGKYPRIFSVGVGVILMGIALSRLIFPSLPPQSTIASTITETPIPPTHTLLPQTNTPTPIPPTDTPVPTKPPHPTAIPTATIDADPTVYDNFNNSEFDGGWNIGLWEANDVNGCKIIQQEGILSFSCTDPSKSPSFNARRLADLKLGDFSFVEAKLRLNYETQPAYGGVVIGIGTSDTLSWGIDCGIIGRDQESLAQTYCWVYPAEKFLDGPRVNYNTWQVVRIEINPEATQLKLIVDGEEAVTYTPTEADALKQAKFGVHLFSYSEGKKGTLITGYTDEVRVGQ